VQYWQLIGIPRPISSYCFYKDICPSPNLYPNLLQLPILHLYGGRLSDYVFKESSLAATAQSSKVITVMSKNMGVIITY